MKGNVITLNENVKCCVVDELNYKNRKFIFCLELDENDEMLENAVHVLEITVKNDKLMANKIEDFEIASVVNNMFMARIANETNE